MIAESALTARHENAICDLVLAAQEGDQHAFGQLLEEHRGMVYNTALGYLGHREDAEDVRQEAFLRAWQKLGQLSEPWQFSGWLHAIAVRTAINAIRRGRKHRQVEWLNCVPEGLPRLSSPEETLIAQETRARVRQAIRRLKEPYRQTAIDIYINGKEPSEITKDVGTPVGTIKSRLSTARQRLREDLNAMDFGGDEYKSLPRKERKISAWTY